MKETTAILVATAALLLSACGGGPGVPTPPPAPHLPVVSLPVLDMTDHAVYPTRLEGKVTSDVRAKVPGYITRVLVAEGQKVRKGQTLFQLETASLSEDAEAAKANVRAAEVEVERLRPLVEKNIVSDVQLQTAKARLAQAEAGLKSIGAQIAYATVKSPVDGYIGAINLREGALVGPSDPTPLTTVSNTDQMFAYFSMNEVEYLNFLQETKGASLNEKLSHFPEVELVLVNGSMYERKGKIETVTGQVNAATGTIQFRAVFDNPGRILATGNSGTVRIPKTLSQVVVVPEVSSYEQQGKTYVYLLQEDSSVVQHLIRPAARIDQLIAVQEGLKEGDRIVAQGIGQLRDQMKIKPRPIPFDSLVHSLKPVFK